MVLAKSSKTGIELQVIHRRAEPSLPKAVTTHQSNRTTGSVHTTYGVPSASALLQTLRSQCSAPEPRACCLAAESALTAPAHASSCSTSDLTQPRGAAGPGQRVLLVSCRAARLQQNAARGAMAACWPQPGCSSSPSQQASPHARERLQHGQRPLLTSSQKGLLYSPKITADKDAQMLRLPEPFILNPSREWVDLSLLKNRFRKR